MKKTQKYIITDNAKIGNTYEGDPVTIVERHGLTHAWVQNKSGTRWFVYLDDLEPVKK